jgi:hypothetical protein
MASLTPFVATPVNPGEPLTAQAWNQITAALAALSQYLREAETVTLAVKVEGDGAALDPATARVVAVSADGQQVVEAARPIGTRTEHHLAGLEDGKYKLHAEAPGFEPAEKDVTVPAASAVPLKLTPRKRFPALFGLPLRQALDALGALAVPGYRIFDTLGREVPAGNPGADLLDAPVLVQLPAAGEPVTAGAVAHLVVAAVIRVEPTVQVPSLAGLTLEEAKKALEALGLTLGKVETRRRRTTSGGPGGGPGGSVIPPIDTGLGGDVATNL